MRETGRKRRGSGWEVPQQHSVVCVFHSSVEEIMSAHSIRLNASDWGEG